MEKTISPHRKRIINIAIAVLLHVCILILIFMHRYTKFEIAKKANSEAEIIIVPDKPWVTRLAQLSPTHTCIPAPETLNPTQTDIQDTEILDTPQKTLSSIECPTQETVIPEQAPEQAIAPISSLAVSDLTTMDTPATGQQQLRQKTTAQKNLQAKKIQARKDLAKLAQSFMGYGCDKTGNGTVSIRSNHNGHPSIAQLKAERYLERIAACLQQSVQANIHVYPYQNQDSCINPKIKLTIATNGFLEQIILETSSGDKEIDAYFMAAFKDAGNSFPPLPSYLGKKSFTTTYEIILATFTPTTPTTPATPNRTSYRNILCRH